LGRIDSDWQNRKVITLAEWEYIKEDDEKEGREESMEDEESPKEEVTRADEGEMLVLR